MGSLICRIDASKKKKAHPQPSDLFRAGLDTPLRLQGHVRVSHVQKSTSTPIQLFLSCTMCVISHFSHVRLFATLWTVALQAPLSTRFSRQEYWVGCHFLFQRIFLTQGSNPHLLHWQAYSLPLSNQVSPSVQLGAYIRGKIEEQAWSVWKHKMNLEYKTSCVLCRGV